MNITDNVVPFLVSEFVDYARATRIYGTVSSEIAIGCTVCAFERGTLEVLGATTVLPNRTWKMNVKPCPLKSIIVIAKDETATYNCDTYDRTSQEVDVITSDSFGQQASLITLKNVQTTDFTSSVAKYNNTVEKESISVDSIEISDVHDIILKDSSNLPVAVSGNYLGESELSKIPVYEDRISSTISIGKLRTGITDILNDGSCILNLKFTKDGLTEDGNHSYLKMVDTATESILKQGSKYFKSTILDTNLGGAPVRIASYVTLPFSISFNINRFQAKSVYNPLHNYVSIAYYNLSAGTFDVPFFHYGSYGYKHFIDHGDQGVRRLFSDVIVGRFEHITISISDTLWEMFIDGVSVGSFSHAAFLYMPPIPHLACRIYLGHPSAIAAQLAMFTDFRVFNKYLTPAEALQVFNADSVQEFFPIPAHSFSKIQVTKNYIQNIGINAKISIAAEFSERKFGVYADDGFSVLSIHGNIINEKSMILGGASILHKVHPSTALNTNSSLPDHNAVSLVVRIQNDTMLFNGIRCIYKSGDSTNGLAVYTDGDVVKVCGRSSGVLTTLSASLVNTAIGDKFVIIYDNTGIYIYDDSFNLISFELGQITAGGASTDQESIGNSAGNSPISGTTNASEYFKGVLSEIAIVEKSTLGFSSKLFKKIAVEIDDTGVQCPVEVYNIDPVYDNSKIRVIVPEISNQKNLKLRIYTDGEVSDNQLVSDILSDVPASSSDDWNSYLERADLDTLGTHEVLKLKGGIVPAVVPVDYFSHNFPAFMYSLSGDKLNTVTRVSSTGSGNVRSNLYFSKGEHHGKKLYCEFVFNTTANSCSIGLLSASCLNNEKKTHFSSYVYHLPSNNYWYGVNKNGNVSAGILQKSIVPGDIIRIIASYDDFRFCINNTTWIVLSELPYHMDGGVHFPFVELMDVGSSVTLRFKESEFTYPVPEGCISWSESKMSNEFDMDQVSFLVAAHKPPLSVVAPEETTLTVVSDLSNAGTYTSIQSSLSVFTPDSNFDYSFQFVAGGSYISFLSSSTFHPEEYDYSIDFYAVRKSNITFEYVMGTINALGVGFYVSFLENRLSISYLGTSDPNGEMHTKTGVRIIEDYDLHHYAISIDSGVLYMFIDGVMDLKTTLNTGVYGIDSVFSIGNAGNVNASKVFNGLISVVRIYKGNVKWTSNFVIPEKIDYLPEDYKWYYNYFSKCIPVGAGRKSLSTLFQQYQRPFTQIYNEGRNTGKLYIEAFLHADGSYNFFGLGRQSHDPMTHIGHSPVGSFAFGPSYITHDTVQTINIGVYNRIAGGVTVGVAVDFENKKMCISVNGIWQGGQNPSTGGTLFAVTDADVAEPLFPMFTAYGMSVTVKTKHSEFHYKCPTGFSSWEDSTQHKIINNNPWYFEQSANDYVYARANFFVPGAGEPARSLKKRNFYHHSGDLLSDQWVANSAISNIKINFDLLEPCIDKRMLLINPSHSVYLTAGIRDFSVYGTNSQTAFENLVYGDLTDLTLLGTFTASIYTESDPIQYFSYPDNETAFRYRVLRIVNTHGHLSYSSIRYIEFQKKSDIQDNLTISVSIDPKLIDLDLDNYPLLLELNESSGRNSFDATSIFDSIGNDFTKFRIYDENSDSLPIEVLKWDATAKTARIYTKVPLVRGSNKDTYPKQCLAIDHADGSPVFFGVNSNSITYALNNSESLVEDDSILLGSKKGFTFNGPYDHSFTVMVPVNITDVASPFCFQTYFKTDSDTPTWGVGRIFGIRAGGASIFELSAGISGGLNLLRVTLYYVGSIDTTIPVPNGVWNHVAVVREFRFFNVYINGVKVFSYGYYGTPTQNFTGTGLTAFECKLTTTGKISYALPSWIVGSGVYTSNFTPPTDFLNDTTRPTKLDFKYNTEDLGSIDIGLVGSDAGKSVWEDYHVVYHLDSIVGGYVKDSSPYGRHGSIMGTCIDSGDSIEIGNNSSGITLPAFSNITQDFSLEFEYKYKADSIPDAATQFFFGMLSNGLSCVFYSNTLQTLVQDQNTGVNTQNIGGLEQLSGTDWNSIRVSGFNRVFDLKTELFQTPMANNTIDSYLRTQEGSFTLGTMIYPGNDYSATGFYKNFRVSKVRRNNSWYDANSAVMKNTLCYFSFSPISSYIENPLPGWEKASVSEFTINTSGLTDTLINFPLDLYLDKTSGILAEDYTSFFHSLAKDSEVTGNFVRDYKFGADRTLNGFYINNIEYGQDDDVTFKTGIKFVSTTLDLSKRVSIATYKHFNTRGTVAGRFYCQGTDNGSRIIVYKGPSGNASEFCVYVSAGANYDLSLRTFIYGVNFNGNSTLSEVFTTPALTRVLMNQWHSFVTTREIDKVTGRYRLKLYFNGELVDDKLTDMVTTFEYSSPILIGCQIDATFKSFDGYLDDFIFSEDVFSEEDVFNYTNRIHRSDIDFHRTVLIKQDYSIPVLKGSALTSIGVSYDKANEFGDIYASVSFDSLTYYVYKDSIWKSIVSKNPTVHGNVGNTKWHYKNSDGDFIECIDDDEATCISTATNISQNQVSVSTVQNWVFSTSSYNALTGMCDVACTISYKGSTGNSKTPEINSIYFNNKKIRVLEPIQLEEYNEAILDSLMYWEYCIGTDLIDITNKINVYCKLSNSTTWSQCTQGNEIPVIVAGMNTIGKQLHIKVEVAMDAGIQSENITVVTKLM